MSVVLLGSPAISGNMSLIITVEADNSSFLSSFIAAPSLGLSTVFLLAFSLHMSRFVTLITIPQVVECVFTLPKRMLVPQSA